MSQKSPRFLVKKKQSVYDVMKSVANRIDTGKGVYYFAPFYFKEIGQYNLEVVPLENPTQDLIEHVESQRKIKEDAETKE